LIAILLWEVWCTILHCRRPGVLPRRGQRVSVSSDALAPADYRTPSVTRSETSAAGPYMMSMLQLGRLRATECVIELTQKVRWRPDFVSTFRHVYCLGTGDRIRPRRFLRPIFRIATEFDTFSHRLVDKLHSLRTLAQQGGSSRELCRKVTQELRLLLRRTLLGLRYCRRKPSDSHRRPACRVARPCRRG
jgi:hypothetical protein